MLTTELHGVLSELHGENKRKLVKTVHLRENSVKLRGYF